MKNTDNVSEIARLLGERGGAKTKQRGEEYYAEIGKTGGVKTRLRGKEYYAEIGRKGALKRWEKKQPR